MNRLIVLIALLALLLAGSADGVQISRSTRTDFPQYHARDWQSEDGMQNDFVYSIIQTRDGYIWIGTTQGLARFDGVHFKPFTVQNTPQLGGRATRALYETSDGTLWVDVVKGGLCSFTHGTFVHTNFAEYGPVMSHLVSRDGSLWIGTTNGVLHNKDGHWTFVGKANGLVGASASALCEDHAGNIWIGTESGLSCYKDKIIASYTTQSGLRTNTIQALCCDHEDNIWIGTYGAGVAQFKGGNFDWFGQPEGLPDNFVNAIIEDSHNQIWAGTLSGVCRKAGNRFAQENNTDGTSYGAILSLMEDAEANIWIGTKEGLIELRHKPFTAFTVKQGLSQNNCLSTCEDKDGVIWVATWGGGLNTIKDGVITPIYNSHNSKLSDLLLCVQVTHDGSVWAGADYDGRLFRIKDGQITHYGPEQGLKDKVVRVLYEDRENNLWIAAGNALYQWHDDKLTRFGTREGLPNIIVRAVCEDNSGTLWVGTTRGLYRREDQRFVNISSGTSLDTDTIMALYPDDENNLWIGIGGRGGLARWRAGRLFNYTAQDGLAHNTVSSVVDDNLGNIWMSCLDGVSRVRKKDLNAFDQGQIRSVSCKVFGRFDGMPTTQCNGLGKPSVWKAADGRLWFPTMRGITVVDPASIRDNDAPPPVIIEDIFSDKNPLPLTGTLEESDEAVQLKISPGRGEIEFHYTAPTFSNPEKSRFKYKLSGVDPDWVDAGTRRVAYYNNLAPGRYDFQVIGCSSDGVWNDTGAKLSFILLPHFYQSYYFYALVVGLIVLMAFGVYYVRVRQLKTRQVELQKLVDQRTSALETAHQRLLESSRKAGMAEVAGNILHNVGNVLNSVNVSANLAMSHVRNSKRTSLSKLAALLQQHSSNLVEFFTNDSRGKHVTDYIDKLDQQLREEQTEVAKELESLCLQVDHIKEIVAMQQNYARVSGVVEKINIIDLVEDAVRMNASSLARHDVKILREFCEIPSVATEKHKVLQIFVNLIRNAQRACDDENPQSKQIILRIKKHQDFVAIEVADNGIGIPPENLTKIFSHGFTTRKDGHGFGLHSGAIIAKELRGSLTVHSEGLHQGATFILMLPLNHQSTPPVDRETVAKA